MLHRLPSQGGALSSCGESGGRRRRPRAGPHAQLAKLRQSRAPDASVSAAAIQGSRLRGVRLEVAGARVARARKFRTMGDLRIIL